MQTTKLWSIQRRNEKDMPSTSDVHVCERETDRPRWEIVLRAGTGKIR